MNQDLSTARPVSFVKIRPMSWAWMQKAFFSGSVHVIESADDLEVSCAEEQLCAAQKTIHVRSGAGAKSCYWGIEVQLAHQGVDNDDLIAAIRAEPTFWTPLQEDFIDPEVHDFVIAQNGEDGQLTPLARVAVVDTISLFTPFEAAELALEAWKNSELGQVDGLFVRTQGGAVWSDSCTAMRDARAGMAAKGWDVAGMAHREVVWQDEGVAEDCGNFIAFSSSCPFYKDCDCVLPVRIGTLAFIEIRHDD